MTSYFSRFVISLGGVMLSVLAIGCTEKVEPPSQANSDTERQVQATENATIEDVSSADETSPPEQPDESKESNRLFFRHINSPTCPEPISEYIWWSTAVETQREAEYLGDFQASEDLLKLMLKHGVQEDCAPWRMDYLRVLMEDHQWLTKLPDLDRQAVIKLLQLGSIRVDSQGQGKLRWKFKAWQAGPAHTKEQPKNNFRF